LGSQITNREEQYNFCSLQSSGLIYLSSVQPGNILYSSFSLAVSSAG